MLLEKRVRLLVVLLGSALVSLIAASNDTSKSYLANDPVFWGKLTRHAVKATMLETGW
jgi:hypothetical protein